MSLYQVVARFTIQNDGDLVTIGYNPNDKKLYITSEMDRNEDICRFNDVRRTIYHAMGEEPRTCQLPLVITDLIRQHTEIEPNNIVLEYCTPEQCDNFLTYTWDSLVANKIFASFTVTAEV